MFQGIGDTYVKTKNLAGGATAQRLAELFLYEFNFESEAEELEAKAYSSGIRRTKAAAQGEITDTLTLSFQYVDWAGFGFMINQFPVSESSAVVPLLKRATVPTTSPYEITDAAITAGNSSQIFVYINEQGAWGQPGYLARGTTPNARQVNVDTTNTKLVFNAAQAGAPFVYTIPQTFTTVETYGGSGSPTRYGEIEFWGVEYLPNSAAGWKVYFPSLTPKGSPSIQFTGDVPTLEVAFSANTPAGWSLPYKKYNLDTAVV